MQDYTAVRIFLRELVIVSLESLEELLKSFRIRLCHDDSSSSIGVLPRFDDPSFFLLHLRLQVLENRVL